ncbi:MAG TPA: zf-HC2 domain-containing protein, partial [Armatimonadota bacterium]
MLKPCNGWNERVSTYLDGEGDAKERKAVEAHLHDCA